jgi:hypothetical protein
MLGLLVSVIALWMGLIGPGSAAAAPTLPITANTCDTNHHSAHVDEGVRNRGPQARPLEVPTQPADAWSSGPAECSPSDKTGVNSDYMKRAALGHDESLSARTCASVGVIALGYSRARGGRS